MFITTAAVIYSLGHGLHTFTAVPRSTPPSTLRGLSNNNNGDGLTAQVNWLGLRAGDHPALSLHSLIEPGELLHHLGHDDSTINIVVVIIIIVIIITRIIICHQCFCLQCFDTVGWAAGRACEKTEWWGTGMVVWSEVQTCIWPS